MKILIVLNHPAHYYLFKYIIAGLKEKNHEVNIVIKEKDILEELLTSERQEYTKINERKQREKSVFSVISRGIIELITQDVNLYRCLNKFKADILIGTDIAITHIGRLRGTPSIVFNEDDYEINKLFCLFSYPFVSHIVSPFVCNVGKYKYKKISYSGYQKLAYLHPNHFKPDRSIVQKHIPHKTPYFIIRLVSFTAGHDIEQKHGGISPRLVKELINKLEKKGDVYINSEIDLPVGFNKYKLKINPLHIHHFLYYSDLFISDSQSMSVEAAMIGSPSIRFNSFAGKISILEELEHKYELTFGIHNTQPQNLFEKIDGLLNTLNLKEEFQKRRMKMLSEKIDVTAFMVWLIENYPKSVAIMKENPDYQNNFRSEK